MKNLKFKKKGIKAKKNVSGITLISLVVTIIVLLILAGVSISILSGDNSILMQATRAKEKTIVGQEQEQVKLAYMSAMDYNSASTVDEESLRKELDKYTGEGKTEITDNGNGTLNVKFYDTNNYYTINKGKVEQTAAKITNKKIILSNSSQEILFDKTISQEDVDAISGKSKTNYEILGISSQEDGEYSTKAQGNYGELEIQGDNNNAVFKYTLTDFMKGNETFFVKYTIDGINQENQKLEVVQADVITYEEDFIKIAYEGTGIDQWEFVENANFSNGKALKMICSETYNDGTIKFDFTGSAIEFVTATTNEQIGVYTISIYDKEGNRKVRRPCILDEEEIKYNIKYPYIDLKENDLWSFQLSFVPSRDYSQDPPKIITSYVYFDAVVIYK